MNKQLSTLATLADEQFGVFSGLGAVRTCPLGDVK
jgi:hypothetical protein